MFSLLILLSTYTYQYLHEDSQYQYFTNPLLFLQSRQHHDIHHSSPKRHHSQLTIPDPSEEDPIFDFEAASDGSLPVAAEPPRRRRPILNLSLFIARLFGQDAQAQRIQPVRPEVAMALAHGESPTLAPEPVVEM